MHIPNIAIMATILSTASIAQTPASVPPPASYADPQADLTHPASRAGLSPGIAFAKTPSASQAETDRATLVAGELAWGRAYVTGDTETVRRLLATDFVGIGSDGSTYNKAEAITAAGAVPHLTADVVDEPDVRLYGDTAVVQAHEHEIGSAPEFHPTERVFTDTWVKRGGEWQIVAAEDLDPGLPTVVRYRGDIAVIKAARAANNRAIAAHDLKAFLPMFAEDAVFTWSNGTHAVAKKELTAFFSRDFTDPNFDRYVRTPAQVSVSDRGVRALERGSWTALKKGTRYGGDYIAHWMKGPEGWHVVGELYVKLYCTGPLCTD